MPESKFGGWKEKNYSLRKVVKVKGNEVLSSLHDDKYLF